MPVRSRWRRAAGTSAGLVAASVASLLVVAPAPVRASTSPTYPIGDSCLIGQWTDGSSTFTVHFHEHYVAVTGGAGATETDQASGASLTDYTPSRHAYGSYRHHRLAVAINGTETSTLTASTAAQALRFAQSELHDVSLTFTYRGTKTVRHLHADPPTYTSPYTCTSSSYTDSAGVSTRISTSP